MSVNVHVNVRRCMAVDDCLQWSVHVSVRARAYTYKHKHHYTHKHERLRVINLMLT